jgi:hypothetical protein
VITIVVVHQSWDVYLEGGLPSLGGGGLEEDGCMRG